MTDNLKHIQESIIKDIETEQKNIHLSLVEDCMKVELLLFGFYPDTHKTIIEHPEDLFDKYYDMNIAQLELEHASLCAKASAAARALINWGGML